MQQQNMTRTLRGALRAFTLVELAIVIVIAGILAAVAIPIYQNMVNESKYAEAETAVGSAAQAMDTWRARTGAYDATGPSKDGSPAAAITTVDDANWASHLGVDMSNVRTKWTFSMPTKTATTFLIRASALPAAGLTATAGVTRNQAGVIGRIP